MIIYDPRIITPTYQLTEGTDADGLWAWLVETDTTTFTQLKLSGIRPTVGIYFSETTGTIVHGILASPAVGGSMNLNAYKTNAPIQATALLTLQNHATYPYILADRGLVFNPITQGEITPQEGWVIYNSATNVLNVYNGVGWDVIPTTGSLAAYLPLLGGTMTGAAAINFRDAAIYIASLDDGHLDLEADISIDLNADVVASGDVDVGDDLRFTSDAAAIDTNNDDDDYSLLRARDTGVGLVEVARAQGAADPYFAMGGAQQFRFYNSGYLETWGPIIFTVDDQYISAPWGDATFTKLQAKDTGVGRVEVARLQGAADPYLQFTLTPRFTPIATASLPGTPVEGMATYDDTKNAMTYYDGAAWKDLTRTQQIMGGSALSGLAADTTTRYNSINDMSFATSVDYGCMIVPIAGTFKTLRTYIATVPGAGDSRTFDLYIEGAGGNLTTTYGAAENGAKADTANTDVVAAGDQVSLRSRATGTPASTTFRWGIVFEPT